MSRVSAPPKPQTPGQANPHLRPRTETGRSKLKTWRRRPSRLGAFTWEKWWRVFWAILPWLAFLRSLTILGLSAVELSNSARLGLKNASAAMLCMCCSLDPRWQRCRAHFRANLLASWWAHILLTGEYRWPRRR